MSLRFLGAFVCVGAAIVLAGCAGFARHSDWPPARIVANSPPTRGEENDRSAAPVAPIPPDVSTPGPLVGALEEASLPDQPPSVPSEADSAWDDYMGSSRLQLAAIQTLVDREHFSPGVVDGVWGPKSEAALKAWQQKHALPATGAPDRQTLDALGSLKRAFRMYAVTEEDHSNLAPVPTTWVGKSQAEHLGYETVEEMLAERFHSSRSFLRFLNPDAPWPNPPPGTRLKVPDVSPAPYPAAAQIEIRLREKVLRVLDAQGQAVALFPCSIGRDRARLPRGELRVVAWADQPKYYFDPAIFPEDPEARTLTQNLVLPPGPNNPVGTAWISLSLPGYGIHGTPHPEDIGKTESHGCFRLANWNAAKLLRMVRPQMPVVVAD
jgi:lipoprotein-anchoring transpeptidase ErfK/SrfK